MPWILGILCSIHSRGKVTHLASSKKLDWSWGGQIKKATTIDSGAGSFSQSSSLQEKSLLSEEDPLQDKSQNTSTLPIHPFIQKGICFMDSISVRMEFETKERLFSLKVTQISSLSSKPESSDQVALVRRFAPRITACYDADVAGLKAVIRAISLCFEQGIEINVMTLPKGNDPDNFMKKYGPKKFNELLDKSTPALKFLIDSQVQGKNLESPEGKSKVAKSIVDQITRIPDPVIRSEHLKKASEYLSIEEKILRSMVQLKKPEKQTETKVSFLNAEKRLLQILFEDSRIASAVFNALKEEDFKGLRSEPIFKILSDFFNNGSEPDFQSLREKIEKSLFSNLSQILQEKEQLPSVEEALECVRALRQFSLENQFKAMKFEIKKLEKTGDTKKILAVIKRLQDIKMQLSSLSSQELQNEL